MAATGDVAPLQQFIVKLHIRCILSCDYCYVYHHVDQSWRYGPPVMAPATIQALADRIGVWMQYVRSSRNGPTAPPGRLVERPAMYLAARS